MWKVDGELGGQHTSLQCHHVFPMLRNEGSRFVLGCWYRCWSLGTPAASTVLIRGRTSREIRESGSQGLFYGLSHLTRGSVLKDGRPG